MKFKLNVLLFFRTISLKKLSVPVFFMLRGTDEKTDVTQIWTYTLTWIFQLDHTSIFQGKNTEKETLLLGGIM